MIDPAKLYDTYCEEVPPVDRSQQGAMAFAVEALAAALERADDRLASARKALEELSAWCSAERHKLGGVDGYDYRSGEEFGIRRVEIQIDNKLSALSQAGEESK